MPWLWFASNFIYEWPAALSTSKRAMSARPSQPPPPVPSFPGRLSLSSAIWETVISNEEDEEMDLEEMEENETEEFMDDGFREDLRKLEVRYT